MNTIPAGETRVIVHGAVAAPAAAPAAPVEPAPVQQPAMHDRTPQPAPIPVGAPGPGETRVVVHGADNPPPAVAPTLPSAPAPMPAEVPAALPMGAPPVAPAPAPAWVPPQAAPVLTFRTYQPIGFENLGGFACLHPRVDGVYSPEIDVRDGAKQLVGFQGILLADFPVVVVILTAETLAVDRSGAVVRLAKGRRLAARSSVFGISFTRPELVEVTLSPEKRPSGRYELRAYVKALSAAEILHWKMVEPALAFGRMLGPINLSEFDEILRKIGVILD